MARRMITAREQHEMLSPWRTAVKSPEIHRRYIGPNHPKHEQLMNIIQDFPDTGTDFQPTWHDSRPGPDKSEVASIDWSNPSPEDVQKLRDWHESQVDMNQVILDHNHDPSTNSGSVKAYHPLSSGVIGTMFYTDGEIHDIGVGDKWKHKNIATNMFDMARHHGVELRHSDVLTNDGAAWVRHLEQRGQNASR